jgi:hypothetical protein
MALEQNQFASLPAPDSSSAVILIAARLLFRKRSRRSRANEVEGNGHTQIPGIDSEFYLIEERLAEMGLERPTSRAPAPLAATSNAPRGMAIQDLLQVAALHYRYRFDPHGLNTKERENPARSRLTLVKGEPNRVT